MLLAMSHYSTAEFVKWRDKSHLRPCAAAFTQKDSHAARLMLLCLLLPCMHVLVCSCAQVCVSMCVCSSESLATCELM